MRFELVQGRSAKFWEIEQQGATLTVRFGRIGSAGQTRPKHLASPQVAQAERDSLIAQKLKKGYTRVIADGAPHDPARSLFGLAHESRRLGLARRFIFRRVVEYEGDLRQASQGVAYRVRHGDDVGWGDDVGVPEIIAALERMAADDDAAHLRGWVQGRWDTTGDMQHSGPIIEAMVGLADAFPDMRAIFLGDIHSEEAEISWIRQGDFAKLLGAFPALEHLRVRSPGAGYNAGESLTPLEHPRLRSLCLQTGGLPAQVIEQVCDASLPALEHLELWLGHSNYGGVTDVDVLAPLLSGKLFPNLRYLGLRNAESTDAIGEALVASPILTRIEALDLSMGTLSDAGAEALLGAPAVASLRALDLRHNYLSDGARRRFKKLEIPFYDDDSGSAWKEEYQGETYVYTAVME